MTEFEENARGLKGLVSRWADGHAPHGLSERMLAAALRGASAGYWAGAGARSLAFRCGLRRSHRVDCPVISIGNLTVGGTGKTPLVMETARALSAAGKRVAVVSRGYGRTDASRPVLVSDGERVLVGVEEAGDEPLMMARCLPGVVVVVGARRYEAALLARRETGADVIVLDDGFQHRALARDCDVVLWDTLRSPDAMALLPRGLMREGLGALRRAHALVFTRANYGHPVRRVLGRIKRIAPQLAVFRANLEPGDLRPLLEDPVPGAASPSALKGKRAAAFCGLGNPQSFWKTVESTGAELALRQAFPDHHRPDSAELAKFVRRARDASAECVLITEKDAENLPGNWRPGLPVWTLSARVTLGEESRRFERFLLSYLE